MEFSKQTKKELKIQIFITLSYSNIVFPNNLIHMDKKVKKLRDKIKNRIEKGIKDLKVKTKDAKVKINNRIAERKQRLKIVITKIKGTKKFFFNPFKASSWEDSHNFEPEVLPVNDFSIEDFEELRNHNTEELALSQLNELATNLKTVDMSKFEEEIPRACFILCNTYNKPEYKLGVGPLNDSITVAANHKRMGYSVYYLHNPKSEEFLDYLVLFLTKTTQYLTVYYSGHGSNVKDTSGDEDDGYDEVIVFDDDYILDDLLAEILQENANGNAKVILLNDCCHSGTLWDIPLDIDAAQTFPANIICLSAADDNETAKQGRQGSNDQGFFTFLFFQEIRRNKALNPRDIQNRVSSQLVNYKQCVIVSPTRAELMDQPLFPQD